MNDVEQRLSAMRLAAPSAELDRRIASTIAAACGRQINRGWKLTWWSLGTAVAAGGVLAFFIAPPRMKPAPQTVIYRVEAQGLLREMLLNPSTPRDAPSPFTIAPER